MPRRAPKPCGWSGCGRLVDGGDFFCDRHYHHHKKETRAKERERGSAARRGYDRRWRKFRIFYLRRNPMCAWSEGCDQAAREIDHIKPLARGGSKYDYSNLQALCKAHHSMKTQEEQNKGDRHGEAGN